ncbi:MAG: HD domain-containing protein [Deltaproteobacteria bacterium]|nr:HD domain-containing protein [Deltaproteobacteria bacterium]
MNRDFQRVMEAAFSAAKRVGEPQFFHERHQELRQAEEVFARNELVQRVFALLGKESLAVGHGIKHAQSVALFAAAIVICDDGNADEVIMALVAGLLHDICRNQQDHALLGAQRARLLLADFPLDVDFCERVANAIAVHEAFQEERWAAIGDKSLLANALYDADKFLWGPENFTSTLWEMLALREISLKKLHENWERGMAGVRRVRGSFRSLTGKAYGPDFIDRGLLIGEAIGHFLGAQSGE